MRGRFRTLFPIFANICKIFPPDIYCRIEISNFYAQSAWERVFVSFVLFTYEYSTLSTVYTAGCRLMTVWSPGTEACWTVPGNYNKKSANIKNSMNFCWWEWSEKLYIVDISMIHNFHSAPSTNIHWIFNFCSFFVSLILPSFTPLPTTHPQLSTPSTPPPPLSLLCWPFHPNLSMSLIPFLPSPFPPPPPRPLFSTRTCHSM